MEAQSSCLRSVLFLYVTAYLVMCNTAIPRQPVTQRRVVGAMTTQDDILGKDLFKQNVSYHMNLTSRGLAVLGSAILFEVELVPDISVTLESDSFMFRWMDMASKQTITMLGGLNSSLSLTFSGKNVTAGDYIMTVAAYHKDQPTTIVASQTRKFTLTEKLNGRLILTQNLDYQRDPNTFSTRKLLSLTADIQDQFLQTGLIFDYFWYQGQEYLAKTKSSNYTTAIFDTGNYTLSSLINIWSNEISSLDTQRLGGPIPAVARLSLTDLGGPKSSSMKTQNNPVKDAQFVVQGIFQQSVTFKDPVRACIVRRVDTDPEDRSINLKKAALVNVTCLGSAPSSICINITSPTTNPPTNQLCPPGLFINKLHYQVSISLTSAGWNDVHFFVYNDVSHYQLVESFYGYSPDSINVPALTLPIVFGVLGIIIMIIAGAYILRLRKKPLVEVADFDFHPSLTSSQSSEARLTFSSLVHAVRSMFSRDQGDTEHKHPLLHNRDSVSSQEFYNSI